MYAVPYSLLFSYLETRDELGSGGATSGSPHGASLRGPRVPRREPTHVEGRLQEHPLVSML